MQEFDPKRTALLVIDVLEGGLVDAAENDAVAKFAYECGRVVNACRSANIPVIFCDDQHVPGRDRELELWGAHGICGSPEAEPAACLGRAETDIVIPKRRYSAFFNTDLDLTLRELGVDTVIAIGCDTNICVLQTLADAYFNCYKSIVVEDATLTFLIGTQEGAIEYFEKCYGSEIVTTDELVDFLG
jgi:nicotinamidase-related amidase